MAEYLQPLPQAAYVKRMQTELSGGRYTYARFISAARGPVDFAVYLPPDWRARGKETYPLVFFLHGQDGSEHFFPFAVPATQLNTWIEQGSMQPFVLIALRSGRSTGVEEQWSLSSKIGGAVAAIKALASRYLIPRCNAPAPPIDSPMTLMRRQASQLPGPRADTLLNSRLTRSSLYAPLARFRKWSSQAARNRVSITSISPSLASVSDSEISTLRRSRASRGM